MYVCVCARVRVCVCVTVHCSNLVCMPVRECVCVRWRTSCSNLIVVQFLCRSRVDATKKFLPRFLPCSLYIGAGDALFKHTNSLSRTYSLSPLLSQSSTCTGPVYDIGPVPGLVSDVSEEEREDIEKFAEDTRRQFMRNIPPAKPGYLDFAQSGHSEWSKAVSTIIL